MFDAGVEVLLVLADDHPVHARVCGGDEGRVRLRRTHVRIELQGLADRDVQALVAATEGRRDRRFEEEGIAANRLP